MKVCLALVALLLSGAVAAKPAVPTLPLEIRVTRTPQGPAYTDKHRKILYVLSSRGANSRAGKVHDFCIGSCLKIWAPLSATSDAKPVGAWTIIDGVQGKQWAYQRNPVFTFIADKKASDRKGNGYDDLWSVIDYVPAKPAFLAPPSVDARFIEGSYILTDTEGHALFLADEQEKHAPFLAAMASRTVGDWTIFRDRDAPQWAWKGKAVYLNEESGVTGIPASAKVIRP